MLASTTFGITQRSRDDDWFDPIVDADTRLFVDPFLVFQEREGTWKDAHARIVAHFDHAFTLIAKGGCDFNTLPYKKALALLEFQEPQEFCLGFTDKGTDGLGSGDWA